MRVVFLGFQKWGWASLKGLIDSEHEVSLVITHSPDKCTYKGSFLDKSVKKLALENNIPVIECRNVNKKEVMDKIREACPDVIVSSDWETWICPEVVDLAKKAAINIHDALLPKYGGFSPVNWAVINGEKEAGITVHYIEEILDQGKIILQDTVPIKHEDTVIEVLERIFKKIPELTRKSLNLIENDKVQPRVQDSNKASFYHKILEEDCEIDWNNSPQDIYNFIRALQDPFNNAHTFFKDEKIRIKKASHTNKVYCGIPARLVCREKNGSVVLCGRSGINQPQGIIIEEVQDSTGKVWDANKYFPRMGGYLGN